MPRETLIGTGAIHLEDGCTLPQCAAQIYRALGLSPKDIRSNVEAHPPQTAFPGSLILHIPLISRESEDMKTPARLKIA